MKIKVHGKEEQELKFNIGFIRRLDEKHSARIEQAGIEFGAGLLMANVQLSQKSPVMLSDIIYCASKGVEQDEVDDFIESYADKHDSLDGLFAEVKKEMGKSPVIKSTMKTVRNQVGK